MKTIFWFKKINTIGGVEDFLYYLARKYDFEVYYDEASPMQIERLSKYVECHKYKEPIKCDKFFCNYGLDIPVEAEEKYHIIHCDYKNVWFSPLIYPGFKYLGVSKLVCDNFKELTGIDADPCYIPVEVEKPSVEKYNDGKLHLISTTRLTKEKGLKRMQKLATMLERAGIDYEWKVYSNRHKDFIGKNVIYMDPQLDIINEVAKSDYLVQLSDCEAYCIAVVKALCVGTPVIATDLDVYKELGIIHNKNAVVCDLDMKRVDIDLIKKKSLKVAYKPPTSDWGKYLSSERTYNPNEIVKARALKNIWLVEEDKHYTRHQELEITKARLAELEAKGMVEAI